MAIYGYCRVSTFDQKIGRQFMELQKMGVPKDNIYYDYASGTKKDRASFNRLLKAVSKGDTIVSSEPSRLTRSISHLIEIMGFAKENKIKLVMGSFKVDFASDTPDIMTVAMLQILGVFSQLERDLISERVRSGLRHAKISGKRLGRPVVSSVSDINPNFIKYYKLYENGAINKVMLSELTHISYPTTLKYISIINKNSN